MPTMYIVMLFASVFDLATSNGTVFKPQSRSLHQRAMGPLARSHNDTQIVCAVSCVCVCLHNPHWWNVRSH